MAKFPPCNIRPLFFMLGSLLFLMGCASHPRYGASPRKKKGCDCPKWNALPKEASKEYRVQNTNWTPDIAVSTDAARN